MLELYVRIINAFNRRTDRSEQGAGVVEYLGLAVAGLVIVVVLIAVMKAVTNDTGDVVKAKIDGLN